MKTIFVLNPKAGKGKGLDKIKERIESISKKLGKEAGIYLTKAAGDGEAFARLACEEAEKDGREIRLIACGGDGTLNEVLNGIMGHDCAALGVMPIGTGNDFVRNFEEAGNFMDVEAQLCGRIKRCDAIRYRGLLDGRNRTRYCANMFNIGFDCNVVDLTSKIKKYPLMNGSVAYLTAVAGMFIRKKGANLRIEVDGQVIEDGPVLLTAIANGSFCGGGVKGLPRASVDDGIMDINIIYNVSRMDFLKKFPYYAKGTHLELPDIDDILYCSRCKEVTITPLDGKMRLCTDGEIVDAGKVHMEVVPGAFNFVVPKA